MICRLMDQRLLTGACVTLKPLHPRKLTLSRGTIHESYSPSSLPNLQTAPPERLLCLAIVCEFCDLRKEHWEFCNFHELLGSYIFCKFPIFWIPSSLQAWMLQFQRNSHLTASAVPTISNSVSILFKHKWRKVWMKVAFRSQRGEEHVRGVFKEGAQSRDLGIQGPVIWKDNVKLMGPGQDTQKTFVTSVMCDQACSRTINDFMKSVTSWSQVTLVYYQRHCVQIKSSLSPWMGNIIIILLIQPRSFTDSRKHFHNFKEGK